MIEYSNSFFPGPTSVPEDILRVAMKDYGSADIEPDFLNLYNKCVGNFQKLFNTESDVLFFTGEGMLALWGGIKSCLQKDDKVLCLSTGMFGDGMAPMAQSIGCQVKIISFPNNDTFNDYDLIEQTIREFKPKMITAVQCETPSGIMNDISVIGMLKKKYDVPLLYVDAVSAVGGARVNVDENNIDICLGGSQKALSVPPTACFASVSSTAWKYIREVKYMGYDSYLDFEKVRSTGLFPYTPSWTNIAQLYLSSKKLLDEGLDNVFERHNECARLVRQYVKESGLKLFPADESFSASTVTAVYIPDGYSWMEWDKHLREKGIVCGGNWGKLANKVFRIGHMGNEATIEHVKTLCGML